MLARAGFLAEKRIAPESAGTFPVTTPLFVVLLISVILIVGALTFFPALVAWARSSNICSCRQGGSSSMAATKRPLFDPTIVRRAIEGVVRQTGAATHGAKPGDVRGAGRQRVHHARAGPGAATGRARLGFSSSSRCGSGSRCCSRISPRRWPKAGARPRPTRCARPAGRRRPSDWRTGGYPERLRPFRRPTLRKGDLVSVRRVISSPAMGKSWKASHRWTSRRSLASRPRSSASPAATARRSPAAQGVVGLVDYPHHGRTPARRSSTG